MSLLDMGISVTLTIFIILLTIPWIYPVVTDMIKLLDYNLKKAKVSGNKFFQFWTYLTITSFILLIILLLCKILLSLFNM